ncbi:hypothetical protein K491DRAFT_485647 [Lophiostoma macrostomum CBS 122681]|uniref:Uncharacterized protein n=1 Tax=Lophiostoma macrostomum CBS 122681 TaxID=1314788 RepID=A0A6A6T2R0_9PLEO|nr:hypothetical protein K491DRAFT_485647 [Lophiostoma macrostomum CBS 122681]
MKWDFSVNTIVRYRPSIFSRSLQGIIGRLVIIRCPWIVLRRHQGNQYQVMSADWRFSSRSERFPGRFILCQDSCRRLYSTSARSCGAHWQLEVSSRRSQQRCDRMSPNQLSRTLPFGPSATLLQYCISRILFVASQYPSYSRLHPVTISTCMLT